MVKNYLKTAWRSLVKNKAFTLINIFGLATGIAFALIAGFYIWSELRANSIIKNSDKIYIIQSRWKDADMGLDFTTLAPLSKALHENYPHLVSDFYRHDGITSIVSHGDKKFSEGLQVGDASMLTLFGLPVLYGNAATAFDHPASVVITASKAIKYFGRKDVVGQTLTISSFSGSKQDFEITAVMKDPDYNTVTYWGNGINKGSNEIFLPASSLSFFGRDKQFESWQNAFIISYVCLKDGVKAADLDAPVKNLLKLNAAPDVQKNLQVYFTPVADYYLQSNGGLAWRMIYSLGAIALFILLMAVINFVNISIGNSVSRLREIGVRKVMGGTKQQLMAQFLCEAVLTTAFSVLVAFILYLISRSFFSNMLGRSLPSFLSFPLQSFFIGLAAVLVIGMAAGLYPAFVLSKQNSVESLKGKLKTAGEKKGLRYSLMTIQFVTAVVVFIAAIVINKQIEFFFNTNLGYTKERIITAKVPRDWTNAGVRHMETIRSEFEALPQVARASLSFEIPDGASASINTILYKAGQDSSQGINTTSLYTDEKYAATYEIPLLAGTFFNEGRGLVDTAGLVLNEAAVKALGWTDAQMAIGQMLKIQGSPALFPVTGVVKDFHFGPMQEAIRPMFFIHVRNATLFRYLSFKLAEGDLPVAIAALQKKWTALMPDAPFDYVFMDDTLAKLYTTEMQMRKASEAATIIAFIIVLLGVLSMVMQSMARRVKEVGIRKVLGASAAQVMGLFAGEFWRPVLIANCIAWPVAWLVVSNWLHNYAYRIQLTPVPFIIVFFVLAGLITLPIILQTIKAALTNPAKSLRTE